MSNFTNKFNHKQLSRFLRAKLDGTWYDISHFAKVGTVWNVWFVGGTDLIECSRIQLWDVL